jgi:hypothetical protein
MAYKKKIYPEAKSEKQWLCSTYGNEFCEALETWCEHVLQCAPDNPKSLLLIPLEEVLDETHDKWGYVWKKIRDQTALDRLKSLIAFIHTRKPPYELLAAHARIHTQGAYWVNVITVVEVDRASEVINFTLFTWYGD